MQPRLAALVIAIAALGLGACEGVDPGSLEEVVVSGSRVLVGGSYDPDLNSDNIEDSRPMWFLSEDDGASFDPIEPRGLDVANYPGELFVHDGAFYQLTRGQLGPSRKLMFARDGRAWIDRSPPGGAPTSVFVDGDGLHVLMSAGEAGIATSTNGLFWTVRWSDRVVSPPLIRVAGTYVAVGGSGTILTSATGEQWTEHVIPTVTDFYALAPAAGGGAFAIVRTTTGGDVLQLVKFDPLADTPATFVPMDGYGSALLLTPAGLLVGDGSLVPDGDLTQRHPHVGRFVGGSVDGDRVVIAQDDHLLVSTDGGATFQTIYPQRR